jgi:hypothetical protein
MLIYCCFENIVSNARDKESRQKEWLFSRGRSERNQFIGEDLGSLFARMVEE